MCSKLIKKSIYTILAFLILGSIMFYLYKNNKKNIRSISKIEITKKIVAIGGGDYKKDVTLTADQEMVRLSGKENPKLLFVPTGHSDDDKYCKDYLDYFQKKLHVKTDTLFLVKENPTIEQIKEKVFNSDIVYISGGDTLFMIALWKTYGFDKILKEAWEKGIVLGGTSAGSICWFEGGHSDSLSFTNQKNWHYIIAPGLGFFKGINCPHFNTGTEGKLRINDFKKRILETNKWGIATDEGCAIEFINDKFKIISYKETSNAYKVFKEGDAIKEVKIKKYEELMPIEMLYQK
ncbi:TPA: peptidase E [Candidatus Dependentiae bacterium]|nr:MAG: Peptidase S51 dipeptidase E [candidate division TM6 bacterium GW2011_GWE2_31_21]KKP53841.1 MAG: Peptidase S51 dipeptidase E [candidate division TM6 bacterium GW2011_GWF2_33_332]HBS47621.1 peptidase E [Candidatus Dependentiae bacterium]HBZ73770.1 peptidase E [Candidatus Dependentiae bacterium]